MKKEEKIVVLKRIIATLDALLALQGQKKPLIKDLNVAMSEVLMDNMVVREFISMNDGFQELRSDLAEYLERLEKNSAEEVQDDLLKEITDGINNLFRFIPTAEDVQILFAKGKESLMAEMAKRVGKELPTTKAEEEEIRRLYREQTKADLKDLANKAGDVAERAGKVIDRTIDSAINFLSGLENPWKPSDAPKDKPKDPDASDPDKK